MKYTAWSVIAIGIGIFAFWGILTLVNQSGEGQANGQTTFLSQPGPLPLLLVSGIAVVAGVLLLVVGGRGYIRTKNPAVHN